MYRVCIPLRETLLVSMYRHYYILLYLLKNIFYILKKNIFYTRRYLKNIYQLQVSK